MPEITDSSHIKSADWENGVLTLGFKGGSKYEVYDVSYDKFQELMAAPSKGKFYNTHILGSHTIARV